MVDIIVKSTKSAEEMLGWSSSIDNIFGSYEDRRSGIWKRPLPKEFNWHPHFYRGETGSFDQLYEFYVKLE